MKLILVRHGESLGNVDLSMCQDEKMNFLTSKGVKEVEIAAIRLKQAGINYFNEIYCSALTRARHTTSILVQSICIHDYKNIQVKHELNERSADKEENVEDLRPLIEDIIKNNEEHIPGFDDVPDWMQQMHGTLSTNQVLIVSHWHTMQAIFNILKLDREKEWCKLRHVPCATPFIIDTITNHIDIFNQYKQDNNILI